MESIESKVKEMQIDERIALLFSEFDQLILEAELVQQQLGDNND